ncbi:MAG TPA: type I CRISPR-associated protein Cas7 [Bryobacteraceae bacterium]|jgi:Cas7 group CRISPR-associated protein Csh2|nr:type I CRISPR-associated protein Cas7 [Bryobacteraceae bacterium]
MTSSTDATMKRATGLLIIEAVNSNPNGDPDRESDPRQRPDERGEISPVSVKRKIRDLVEDKEGPVWAHVSKSKMFDPKLSPEEFAILESRGRDRSKILQEVKNGIFQGKYWDGRLFGNTFLEEGLSNAICTGVVQFGLGVSVAPIRIERLTTTNKSGVQEGKDRGMAPLAYRVVEHAIYTMPFFVNPSAARKSGCTGRDVQVLLSVIPFVYSQTSSYVRSQVEIKHAWYVEHKSPLGSASDFDLIAALTPKKADTESASASLADYSMPAKLPEELQRRVEPLRDLMAEAYAAASA